MKRRALLTATGSVLIAMTIFAFVVQRRSIEAIVERAATSEFVARNASALHDIRSELDPRYAGALMARALLADALDTTAFAEIESTEERLALLEARSAGLETAQELALETLLARPSHWQAAMVLGGANYLDHSIHSDPALFTEYQRWETPLEVARALAPSQPEPTRFMTMAYLEVWPVLSNEKRSIAEEMIGDTFEDEQTFERAIRPWLAVNSDLEEAFDSLPDRVFVWRRIEQLMAEAGEWHLCAKAHERHLDAMWSEFTTRSAEAIARIEGGDIKRGRDRMFALFTLPPHKRFASLLERSLTAFPAGPVPGAITLRPWVLWENDRCLYDTCTFPRRLMERLAYATDRELAAVDAARAMLSFDDLASAERTELTYSDETHEREWAPYYLQKIPRLLERQEIAKAISALAAVHSEERSAPAFLLAKMAVNEAAGDRQATLEAQADLSLAARVAWRPSDWRMLERNHLRLQMLTAAESSGLTIDWHDVPTRGGVVSLFLDGRRIATRAISQSRVLSFQFDRSVSPGLHILEIQLVAGQVGVPGTVDLIAHVE